MNKLAGLFEIWRDLFERQDVTYRANRSLFHEPCQTLDLIQSGRCLPQNEVRDSPAACQQDHRAALGGISLHLAQGNPASTCKYGHRGPVARQPRPELRHGRRTWSNRQPLLNRSPSMDPMLILAALV